MASPLLYDLTELQRHANRVFGFSAQQTLNLAQALYERHKLISYPRTDSRHLSQDVALTLAQIVKAIAAPYQPHCAPGTGERPLGRRFVDDAKVTDHHAIIPTTSLVENASLSSEERKIYDLICRRLLSAWHDDHIASTTTVITAISNGDVVDRYHTSGPAVQQVGWKVLDLVTARKPGRGKADTEEQKQVLPSGLKQGDPQEVLDVKAERGGRTSGIGTRSGTDHDRRKPGFVGSNSPTVWSQRLDWAARAAGGAARGRAATAWRSGSDEGDGSPQGRQRHGQHAARNNRACSIVF